MSAHPFSEPVVMEDLSILLRLLVSAVLTALIGFERERSGKSAGLRTHVLVGVASTLFVGTGRIAAVSFQLPVESLRVDPISLIQAVAVGIGFLGSSVVFVARRESRVLGLTTAGSIWATAAVGVAVGFERYVLGIGATVILLIVLGGLARFEVRRSRETAGR